MRAQDYSAVFRGERPVTVTAAETASRAAVLLGSAGWGVTTSQEYDGGKRCSVVVARRDGNGIRIRTGDHTSAVMFSGQTPALALHPPEPFQWPDPVRTPETVTPGYVLCYECGGLGWCRGCGGRGWVPSEPRGRTNCTECRREQVCQIRRGGGQLTVFGAVAVPTGLLPGTGLTLTAARGAFGVAPGDVVGAETAVSGLVVQDVPDRDGDLVNDGGGCALPSASSGDSGPSPRPARR
ncbi:hypothetical protein ACWC9T_15365 [Kitasatospora sp. NPDC001159]